MKRFLTMCLLVTLFTVISCDQPTDPLPITEQSEALVLTLGGGMVQKQSEIQASVTFGLATNHTGTWRVYNQATGGTALADITVTFDVTTRILTLTHATDIPHGPYWVTVTESGKTESPRLALTIIEFVPGQSTHPDFVSPNAVKTELEQASVTFTLTAAIPGLWLVYDQAEGGIALTDITATAPDTTLTLSHATDIPSGNYWVTVTESGKTESLRRQINVSSEHDPGMPTNPFVVATEEHLWAVGRGELPEFSDGPYAGWTLDKHYKQTAHIELEDNPNWVKIGASSPYNGQAIFTGSYDGQGFSITGLIIDGEDRTDNGFFSTIGDGAVVKNLSLIDAEVTGSREYAGILAARNRGTVENVFTSGSVTGNFYSFGGIIGHNYGLIKNSYSTANVTSETFLVGGIAGAQNINAITEEPVKVINSFATGRIQGGTSQNIGGLVGQNRGSTVTEKSIALNERVISTISGTNIGRVNGSFSDENTAGTPGSAISNYAWVNMPLFANNAPHTATSGFDLKDGESKTGDELREKATWEALGFDFSASGPWTWDDTDTYMPSLHGEQIEWPVYLVMVPSDTPATANATYTKTVYPQNTATFTLTNTYDGSEVPKVYASAGGNDVPVGITVSLSGNTLTLTSDSNNLIPGNFWVSVQETGKLESGRLQLRVEGPKDPGGIENPFEVTTEADLRAVGRGGLTGFTTGEYVDWTLDKHYIQTANITVSSTNWIKIGSTAIESTQRNFTGTYDGDGHTIEGLRISGRSGNTNTHYHGLFSNIGTTGVVKNLGLIDAIITDVDQYGGLIAARNDGLIENCFTTGSVDATSYAIGGIVGHNYGTISNSYSTANVTSTNQLVGGITGAQNNAGTKVINSFATGRVQGGTNQNIGGIVGENRGSTLTEKSIALNERITLTIAGTQIGRVNGNFSDGGTTVTPGSATNNYAWDGMPLFVNNNTPHAATSDLNLKDGLDKTGDELLEKATWEALGFDFSLSGPWTWDDTGTYMPSLHGEEIEWPVYLKMEQSDIPATDNATFMKTSHPQTSVTFNLTSTHTAGTWRVYAAATGDALAAGMTATHSNGTLTLSHTNDVLPGNYYVTVQETDKLESARLLLTVATPVIGDGSESDPFQVRYEVELRAVGRGTGMYADWSLNAHYVQIADITLTGGNWIKVGATTNGGAQSEFFGSYDGRGHSISGLNINGGNFTDQAFFSTVQTGAVVKNLRIIDAVVTNGQNYTAILVARNYGTIENVFTSGSVTVGSFFAIGGIVGHNYGLIENCYSTANVTGQNFLVGGIAGAQNTHPTTLEPAKIINSFATGRIQGGEHSAGNHNTGGLVGMNRAGTGVENSIALNERVTSTVNTTNIGRIVGLLSNAEVPTGYTGEEMAHAKDNYAWAGMPLFTSTNTPFNVTDAGIETKHGEDKTAAELKDIETWKELGFDFDDVWTWDTTGVNMPSLHGEQIPWPAHLTD